MLVPVNYEVDGRPATGYLADGSTSRSAPGVLVAHEGLGMSEHVKRCAEMLAELGYVAFALDLYGEAVTGVSHAIRKINQLSSDLPRFRRIGLAGLNVLERHEHVDNSRLAAVGFCFGGAAMLELARGGADLKCVVGFHPSLATVAPHGARHIRGKILICVGDQDPIVSKSERDTFTSEMTLGDVDWQMMLLGGVGHSFTNERAGDLGIPGVAYSSRAAARSWTAMTNLFDETISIPPEGGNC
jgi:dienelactone hydrolase